MDNKSILKTIDGIKRRDQDVLKTVYKDYYPKVLGYILKCGGSKDDAKDIFQEVILAIYKLVDTNKLVVNQDFGSYVVGIAKRLYGKQINKERIHDRYVNQEDPEYLEDHPSDLQLENERELQLIRKYIIKLGEECRKVLMWSAQGITNTKIALKMGYKNEKTVRTKKNKCKNYLVDMIKKDPNY